jgi:hypothetical protein
MRYMLLFVGLGAQPEATDEQTANYNAEWGEWMGALANRGALLSGAPLEARGSVVSAEGSEELRLDTVDIGGFALIEAADEASAADVARQAPHTALGGRTIVRPLAEVGGT